MPTRVQALSMGLGIQKQTDIATAAGGATYMRMRKLDMNVYTADYQTEDDAAEIGKGNEFITQVFPTNYEYAGELQKFGSTEFVTWAWAYALGDLTGTASTAYTVKPIDPNNTIELPYFPMVLQINEGGVSAFDELHLGNMISEVTTNFEYGTGRRTVTSNARFLGSGRLTSPSSVTLPTTVQSENYMLSASMAATINGVDYVAGKTLVRGTIGWNNNPLAQQGFFPGCGIVNNAAVRGRIEIGARVPTFTFDVRVLNNSTEYTKLLDQTTGTAVVTLTYDATHNCTWTFPSVSFKSVVRDQVEGILTVRVVAAPKYDTITGTVLTFSSVCPVTGIAQ